MGVKVREKVKGFGEWWIFINHNGRRKSKKIGKDKRLAREAAKKIEARLVLGDLDLHSNGPSRVPTFKQYIFGRTDSAGQANIGWFEKYARLALKNSSCVGYENLLKTHLLPEFGNKPFDQISSRMIGDFIVKKFKESLRSNTIQNMKNCLSSVLRYAFRPDGYLELNPATGVIVPKPEDERPEREPSPFSWEDRQIIEDVFRNYFSRHYPLVLTGFRAGLKIGELTALQWGDIDFRHRLIHITRNITRGKVTTPKSQSSIRYVRMTIQLTGELKSLLQSRKAEKLKMGWKEMPDWVFYNSNGHFLNYGNFVNRVWNRAMKKSGLCRRTPHDMRHTYATLRLSKGDSLAEVSKEMGHGSTNITYQVYYKWLPKESRTDIDELDNMQPSVTYPQPETKEEFPKLANSLK